MPFAFAACPNPVITPIFTTSISLGSTVMFFSISIAAVLPRLAITSAAARRALPTRSHNIDISRLSGFISPNSKSDLIAATHASGSMFFNAERISFIKPSFLTTGRIKIIEALIRESGKARSAVALSSNISLG